MVGDLGRAPGRIVGDVERAGLDAGQGVDRADSGLVTAKDGAVEIQE